MELIAVYLGVVLMLSFTHGHRFSPVSVGVTKEVI